MRSAILYLSMIALCLGVLAFGGLEILYNWRVKPELDKDRALQAKYHSSFMADVDLVGKAGLLAPGAMVRRDARAAEAAGATVDPKAGGGAESPGTMVDAKAGGDSVTTSGRDAGASLNAKLYWEPQPEEKFGRSKPIVDEATIEWFMRVGTDWVTFAEKKRKIKADLSFFRGLSDFDHWDLERNSPIEKLSTDAKFVPPSKLPLPDTSDLLAAAKLRLIEGIYSKKPLEALADVRQLARLLFTTENLELVLAGLAMLDHERRGYNYYVQQKLVTPSAWQPTERNLTRRAQRSLLAAPSYLRVWTDPAMMTASFSDTTPPGFCAIVNEAYPLEWSIRPMLEPHLPFERDLRDGYARLDTILAKARSACRLRYLTRLIETNMFAEVPGLYLLNSLPYSRKVFGMRFSTANFGGFEAYSQAEASQSTASN